MIENLKKKKLVKKAKNSNKGITLIALVITIIVLLILAGVSIATLTGENGILTQAEKAKSETKNAELQEEMKLAIMASYGEDGKINFSKLNENLKHVKGYEVEKEVTKLPAAVTVDGEKILVSNNGSIKPIETTVAEAKTDGTVFNKETVLVDSYGNTVTIPEGFKIASDSAIEVTKGVVIEDARYTNTIGSQFVWIPVGTVTGTVNGVEKTETIKLSRYTFDENGKEYDQGSKAIYPEWATDYNYQEVSKSDSGNAVAKDIEGFKSSANSNGGYYLGRYEAGLTGEYSFDDDGRTWTGTNMKLVCKEGEQVYNFVTQPQASELSRNMYSGKNFTSDLINSYAWDTAIVFIQKFGEESNSSTYSRTAGLSAINTSEPQTTGTNILQATGKTDKQCNIFDMAGNTFEWSTETSSYSDVPCVFRGGIYRSSDHYTSYRDTDSTSGSENNNSFRPLLYL